jgi:hypothetical protein
MTETKTQVAFTLPMAKFWSWLVLHPNCIVRAGTPDAVLFDDEDLHWHFESDEDGSQLVQVIRGKKLLGELAFMPSEVTYVQVEPGDSEEYRFDLVSSDDPDSFVVQFVMSHAFDEDDRLPSGRFTH